MELAGSLMHLASHAVGGNHTLLCAAGDVEGHRGNDGRYYLLDLARAYPPIDRRVMNHLPVLGQPEFFRVFRPEFLQLLRQVKLPPLSPDALTNWGANQEKSAEMNRKVTEATLYLRDVVISRYGCKKHPSVPGLYFLYLALLLFSFLLGLPQSLIPENTS